MHLRAELPPRRIAPREVNSPLIGAVLQVLPHFQSVALCPITLKLNNPGPTGTLRDRDLRVTPKSYLVWVVGFAKSPRTSAKPTAMAQTIANTLFSVFVIVIVPSVTGFSLN